MERTPASYILVSQKRGSLYTAVTSNPLGRLRQHRAGAIDGFTGRHGIKRMVHIEFFDDMEHAILREGLAIRGFRLPAWRQRLRCR